ncbi:MAG: choline dehydrogenase [Robiginitomaculum sp.]|nr:choline dehydrogenase [Robiginitomaculum sp.]
MSATKLDGQFDYVIIGGGSAGCTLAGRLSEDPDASVCLLEAGPKDDHFTINVPAGAAAIMPKPGKFNWGFETIAQKGLNGRKGYQPRGKTLGGSSSINAMIYIRGHKSDYDNWVKMGAKGWSWKDVLPYFKKSENREAGGNALRGKDGPLNVAKLRSPNPTAEYYLDACAELQLPKTDDFNGGKFEGTGRYEVTQKDGQRFSAAKAYLTPNLERPNLTVITEATTTKINIKDGCATGVECQIGGDLQTITANKEVLVCGGAFASPQILLLSGIGDKDELRELGIDTVHHLPGVGKNLHDHIDYIISYKSPNTDTLGYSAVGVFKAVKAIFEYRKHKTGIFTSNFAEVGGFYKSSPNVKVPDLQTHFVVGIVDDHARKSHWGHGYSCHVCVLRPKSRGTVKLASSDPFAAPLIDPAFLENDEDMEVLLKGVKQIDQILKSPAFDPVRGKRLYSADNMSDDDWREEIRTRADTVYHPVGTCKMGTDKMAVVDPELKVRGLKHLRVIDASVMPQVISGNTNAPTIMIAEKAADMIKADA